MPATAFTQHPLLGGLVRECRWGKWSDKSMRCKDTKSLICTSFKMWKGEAGKETGTSHLHLSFKFDVCFQSDCRLSGWAHYMNTIITHSLGKYVRIHVWHCSNIQTHAHTQTCARTYRTKSKANNVSESLTPVSPLPPLPNIWSYMATTEMKLTSVKSCYEESPPCQRVGFWQEKSQRTIFTMKRVLIKKKNKEKREKVGIEGKRNRKKEKHIEHTSSSYNKACL